MTKTITISKTELKKVLRRVIMKESSKDDPQSKRASEGLFYHKNNPIDDLPFGKGVRQLTIDDLDPSSEEQIKKPVGVDGTLEDEGFNPVTPSLGYSLKTAGKNKKPMTTPDNKLSALDQLIATTPKHGKVTKPGEETSVKDFFKIYPEQEFYAWTQRAWGKSKEELELDRPRLTNLQKLFVAKQGLNKHLGDTVKGTKGSSVVSKTIEDLSGMPETPEEEAEKKKQYNMGVHSHGDVATQVFDVDPTDKKGVNSKRVMTQRLENDLLSQDEEGKWSGKFMNRNRSFLEDPEFMEKFMFTVNKSAFEFTDMIDKFLGDTKPLNLKTVVEFYEFLTKQGVIEPQAFNHVVNREAQAMLRLFQLVKDQSGKLSEPEEFLISDMEESLVIPENIIGKLLTRTPEQVERLLREQFPENVGDSEGEDLIKQMVEKISRFQQLETEGTSQGINNLSAMLKAELEGGDYDHNVDEIDAMTQGFEQTGKDNKDKFLAAVRQELSDIISFFKENFVSGENVFWSFQNYVTKKFNPTKLRVPEADED